MASLLDELGGGDRRSIGNSNQIVRKVLAAPERFAEVAGGLTHSDGLVRMRAADALEKITLVHPDWLAPYKAHVIGLAATTTEQELRWHLAQMLPRLPLSKAERTRASRILTAYLDDQSRIVQTFALQGLADLSGADTALRREVMTIAERLAQTGSAAVRARARKILRCR